MTARISALIFSRYRGFRHQTRITLQRLTLVYGENNAGKSAIVRLPQIVAASRVNGQPGLDLRAPVLRRAAFRDIQWRGPLQTGDDADLTFGIELTSGDSWRWTLRWIDTRAVAVIQRLEVSDSNGHTCLELVGTTRDSPYSNEEGQPAVVTFDGLIPRTGAHPRMDRYRDGLNKVLERVSWLGAVREGPIREGTTRGVLGKLEGEGRAAASLVLADPELRRRVSEWFQRQCHASVEAEALGSELERLVLRPMAGHDVPFPDAGEGIQQVFPLVVAAECLRRDGGLLIVEEPESHLHPRLQRALAELIIEVLAVQPSASVLLETHSEVFLVAALLASTQKTPESVEVGLHWVESSGDGAASTEEIAIDAAGRPQNGRLERAFDTMGVMRRDLLLARRGLERPHGG